MPELVPVWIMRRYSQLWSQFKDKKGFNLEEASKILSEKKEVVTVILSKLRKAGWLIVEVNEEDYRRKTYHLKNPEEMIVKIGESKNV